MNVLYLLLTFVTKMSTNFSELGISEDLVQGIDSMGISTPTAIQAQAIPAILSGSDVLGIAQTGTGKTAAFAIPVIDRFEKRKRKGYKGVRCLVMVPTRELAKQIGSVFTEIGKKTSVRSFGLFGGTDQEQQIRTLKNGVDVLVTTPGRMFDLISQGHLDVSQLEVLVLDEADLMLDLGFNKDIKDVIQEYKKHAGLKNISVEIREHEHKKIN